MSHKQPKKQKIFFWSNSVFIPIFILIGLSFGTFYVLEKMEVAEKPHEHTVIQTGNTLPDFRLTKFHDGTPLFSEIIEKSNNKIIFINFWASWCTSCMVEMPSIVKLRNRFNQEGFEVLAVNLDAEPDQLIPKISEKLKMTFPIFTDLNGQLSELFNVNAIPLTVIVDKNRRILYIENGERDWNSREVHDQIKRWLSG